MPTSTKRYPWIPRFQASRKMARPVTDAADDRAGGDREGAALEVDDDDQRPDGRPLGEAEDVGAAQGVTRDGLEDGARDAERGADHQPHQDPRQPQVLHDECLAGVAATGQGAEHLARCHRVVAGADQRDGHGQCDDEQQKSDRDGTQIEPEGEPARGAHRDHPPRRRRPRTALRARTGRRAAPFLRHLVGPLLGYSRASRAARPFRASRSRSQLGHPPTPYEIDEDGSADDRRDDADLQLAGPGRDPAERRPRRAAGPARAPPQYGRIQRRSGPVMARTTCGTISPTKTIGPQAAVAPPHSSVTATHRQHAGAGQAGRPGPAPVVAEGDGVQRPGEQQREHAAHHQERRDVGDRRHGRRRPANRPSRNASGRAPRCPAA